MDGKLSHIDNDAWTNNYLWHAFMWVNVKMLTWSIVFSLNFGSRNSEELADIVTQPKKTGHRKNRSSCGRHTEIHGEFQLQWLCGCLHPSHFHLLGLQSCFHSESGAKIHEWHEWNSRQGRSSRSRSYGSTRIFLASRTRVFQADCTTGLVVLPSHVGLCSDTRLEWLWPVWLLLACRGSDQRVSYPKFASLVDSQHHSSLAV